MTMLCPSRHSVLLLKLPLFLLVCLAAVLTAEAGGGRPADFKPVTPQPGRFTLFESGQVRPLALSPSGKLLFAANTPDGRLGAATDQQQGEEQGEVGLHHRSPCLGFPGNSARVGKDGNRVISWDGPLFWFPFRG